MTNGLKRLEPVRVAVVGLGYWGPNLLRCVQEMPEAELAWACDARRGQLEAVETGVATITASTLSSSRTSSNRVVTRTAGKRRSTASRLFFFEFLC